MNEKVIVTVSEGKIRGIKEVSPYSKAEYYAFYGIPYAEQPVKNLRFKDPIKVKPWKTIYDGTIEKQGCPQWSFLKNQFWGTEDCLFNNIYTSKLPQKDDSLRPVIVNIHGGAFHTGCPHTKHYGSPAFVMQHDIVYICISYRLHILGFLNLGLKSCSGNQGLKDIIMSLRWIKNNVKSFGGDPCNITLLGPSSGAGAINLLMLSPAVEKGLFHKAILMSGYLMNPVAPYEETNIHHARKVAIQLGYKGDLNDNSKLLLFFKKKTPKEFIECLLFYQLKESEKIAPITGISFFSPTIDPEVLPCSPKKLLESMQQIPIIVGFCERESFMGFNQDLLKLTLDNFTTTFRQNCWGWGYGLNGDDIEEIKKRMELFYTDGKPVLQASLSLKMDIQSDICMSDVYDTIINATAAHLPSSVFVYKFDFEGKLLTMRDTVDLPEKISGTYHGSEYFYWNHFDWAAPLGPRDERTRQMVNTFTKMMTNFATTGEPNCDELGIRWNPSTIENPCYLTIDTPMKMVEGRLNETRLNFWDDIKKEFKRP